jgi:signal transduction histidine kinase
MQTKAGLMTTRIFWLIRATAYVLIAVLALISPPHSSGQRDIQVIAFATVAAALLACLLIELPPRGRSARYRTAGLPVALGVMAAAGGLAAATGGSGQSLVTFAGVAAMAAGTDIDLPAAAAVATAGILPIWIAGPLDGSTFGTLAGYPLLIAACAMFGLNRRSYRVQAEQAAALLEQYEQLRAEQRRADVLDERARIAREIHDVLAHSLGALGIQIQLAKALLTDHGDVGRAVDTLSTAQRMAADGLTETRRAVHALRADAIPLGDELAALAETHRQRYHVPVSLETSGTVTEVPPDAALALLRAAQEAMVNAGKHAPGQPVTIRLGYGDAGVRLSVVNGLDGASAAARNEAGVSGHHEGGTAGGYGLTGMRERLRLLDGTLLAGPRGGEWAVTAELPLRDTAGRLAADAGTIAR